MLTFQAPRGAIPVADFDAINAELKEYSAELSERKQIVAANKCDLCGDDRENIERLKAHVEALGYEFFEMSAATHSGTHELVNMASEMLSELPPVIRFEADYVPPEPVIDTSEDLTIEKYDDVWVVEGGWAPAPYVFRQLLGQREHDVLRPRPAR